MAYKEIYLARRNPSIAEEDWPRTWRSHAVFVGSLGVGGPIELMLYNSRQYGVDAPGVTTEYDGVALLSYATQAQMVRELSSEVQSQIDTDELRVFDGNVPAFTLFAVETSVAGGAPTEFAVIRFLARPEGSTEGEFSESWASYAPSASERSVRNTLIGEPPVGYEFDGISEDWFSSADAARQFVEQSADDLWSFADRDRSVTILTKVTHRWPR
ncbi:MAG: hypothetical protein JWO10_482 [Microbacteriaceae bacterium]|nr:hypothetical protein [Microbacteriaceae bacterium]